MTEQYSSPIPCEDSDGNRYTVMVAADCVPGTAPWQKLTNPAFSLSVDNKMVPVELEKDPETGKEIFVCPELDNLTLFPLT